MPWIRRIGFGAIAIYIAALIAVYFAQRSFMYFPPEEPIPTGFFQQHDAMRLETRIGDRGGAVAIYSRPPANNKPVILFFHGNGSAAYQYGQQFEAFKSWGVGYLAAEYPGYAANPGEPNETDIFEISLLYYDSLIADGVKPEQIVIYGDSLGAAAAVHVANEREAAGLILSAPFLSMQAMARKQMPWLPTGLLLKDKYRSDLKMPAITEPLLLLHGDADELIPYSQGKALFDLHQGRKTFVLIKGGQHHLWNTEMPEHIKAAINTFVP